MSLRRTPLYDVHCQLGARMVEFAGFEMPVQFSSVLQEHAAVRERAGLFDVSHMGQIHFAGPAAIETLEHLISCPVASLKHGGVRYGLLCNDEGGVVDDVTLYRVAHDVFFLCVNASNVAKDLRWVQQHAPPDAGVRDASAETVLLALQGPASQQVIDTVGGGTVTDLGRFSFAPCLMNGVETLVSRTGYTGSDGFEIYLGAGDAKRVFQLLMDAGKDLGIEPCGLGARDTLRLEAALALYGHELDDETSPLEAGLERFVKRASGGFIGHEAMEKRASEGFARRLVGFEVEGRGIARADYAIEIDFEEVGIVTSGAPSPTLGKSIGLGYVRSAFAEIGTSIDIVIRDKRVAARVVETPFVRKPKGKAKSGS